MSPAKRSDFKLISPELNSTGQGILEIIVVIAISSILITSLIILAVRANRNADFSRAQDQASRLAQEGIEIMRSIRDRQLPYPTGTVVYAADCISAEGSPVTPYANWAEFYTTDVVETAAQGCNDRHGKNAYLLEGNGGSCQNNWCLRLIKPSNTVDYETIDLGAGRVFQRRVFIADTATADGGKSQCNIPGENDFALIKQYVVRVSWSDTAGDHEHVVSSCITRDPESI